MDARRHNFFLGPSRDSWLCFALLWALSLSSFLAWPRHTSLAGLKILLIFLLCLSFIAAARRLWLWRWQFSLDVEGRGLHSDGRQFSLFLPLWVSPFACLICFRNQGQEGLMERRSRCVLICADMLPDNQYRHLCRLLLQIRDKKSQAVTQ
ncbi:protein YgfX [Shewanella sedimentimangrovi]|uniref:Uncharacterized protein n=1 Tax=Shewanella sedimentimangrovi TaxID=2814293 RepID=A0ABX7R5D1_9GAMM|nr:protein YgfX [Shewanella sedimentimangrovi]QSX38033.1 hypothetical protein JYB85_04140 [Shewanella sedimentimangrovi]